MSRERGELKRGDARDQVGAQMTPALRTSTQSEDEYSTSLCSSYFRIRGSFAAFEEMRHDLLENTVASARSIQISKMLHLHTSPTPRPHHTLAAIINWRARSFQPITGHR